MTHDDLLILAESALGMAEEFVRDPDEGKGVHTMTLEYRPPKPEAQRLREAADKLDRQKAAAERVQAVRKQIRAALRMD